MTSRSQAESYIKLGKVRLSGKVITKPGTMAEVDADIVLTAEEQYVSRAGLKLASVAAALKLNFKDKMVLDVGSSTGGFTDYALRHGAKKVIAVEVGTNQLHPSLQGHPQIELHEQTDIRDIRPQDLAGASGAAIDIVVADVSFISLREILPHVATLCGPQTELAIMLKPQFEAAYTTSFTGPLKHKGVIKNDRMRRDILKDFEVWAQRYFTIRAQADSLVAGAKGNKERFYLLRILGNKHKL